jgi:hypothetical protein
MPVANAIFAGNVSPGREDVDDGRGGLRSFLGQVGLGLRRGVVAAGGEAGDRGDEERGAGPAP